MKSLLAILIASLLVVSCAVQKKSPQALESLIQQIENNLVPGIVIEGEPGVVYNIEERMAHHKVPGLSIVVIKDGKIHWAKGYGYANMEEGRAVDENTMFQAASISKPVAASAVLKLVEEGKLDLDADVNLYLKGWKIKDSPFTSKEKITLRRLVTHTGGLTVHGFRGYAKGEAVPTVIQVLNGEEPANSAAIVPDTMPGSIWRYSGGGYTIAQKVMEDVSGKPFPNLMNELVLSKIGMTNSTYQQPFPEKYYQQASFGYRGDGQKVAGDWHTYPEMAAAGLWTTPTDLAKFVIAVQNSLKDKSKNFLSPEMTKAMLTKHLGDWGLGPSLSGEGDSLRFSHGGANEGFRCNMMGFAHLGDGVVVMTNSDNGGALAGELLRSVSKAYGWNVYKPTVKKIVVLEDDILKKYLGIYELQPGLHIEMILENGTLLAKQSWDGVKLRLYPESITKFFIKEEGMNVEFNLDEQEQAVSLTVNGSNVLKKKQ